MKKYRRAPSAMLIAVAVGAAVVGCGGGAGTATPSYIVQARTISGLGRLITDGQGITLYLYTPDHRGPSRCYGFCAQQWPPLVLPHGVSRPKAGPGVRAALLGTVRRRNGGRQVTYNGWPLYLWQGDHAPGQATGQDDDMGLWYVVSVTGAVDTAEPPAP